MAQNNYTLSAAWLPVATGPGNATFETDDHPGEWTVISSASPAGIVGGAKVEREKAVSLALVAGEYLHLRGRGGVYVIADTLV
ncbi:hypothetical protein [Cypionkella sp.]|uniref:hypothetical protein n=1 Tax=Cypionkella sp. TaxID=2811411 RepID=UPI0027159098|nr:hypothetical protein [Cypionkella sp.]MDO8983008.1 hypothetical protein [Cypionkella sp.]MDP2047551.1 hypothetical protein [Cypionkella sp.]